MVFRHIMVEIANDEESLKKVKPRVPQRMTLDPSITARIR